MDCFGRKKNPSYNRKNTVLEHKKSDTNGAACTADSGPCCLLKLNGYTFFFASLLSEGQTFNPTALRKAKIVCNFDLSQCNRVEEGVTEPV